MPEKEIRLCEKSTQETNDHRQNKEELTRVGSRVSNVNGLFEGGLVVGLLVVGLFVTGAFVLSPQVFSIS